jgi:hypothetical protein
MSYLRRQRAASTRSFLAIGVVFFTIGGTYPAWAVSPDIPRIQAEAEKGSVQQEIELGAAYLMGRGVERNEKQAAYWYEKAANSGPNTLSCEQVSGLAVCLCTWSKRTSRAARSFRSRPRMHRPGATWWQCRPSIEPTVRRVRRDVGSSSTSNKKTRSGRRRRRPDRLPPAPRLRSAGNRLLVLLRSRGQGNGAVDGNQSSQGLRETVCIINVFQREAKYLMNASSAGHGTVCVSALLRTVQPSSSAGRNAVQNRPACAHSSA